MGYSFSTFYDHGTYGWRQYEEYVARLASMGIPYTEERKDQRYVRGPGERCWCQCTKEAPHQCPWCTETCSCFHALRVARWTDPARNRRMVCEEYLAVNDTEIDGNSMVGILVYEEGHRPEFWTIDVGDLEAFNAEFRAEYERYEADQKTEAYDRSHVVREEDT